jgi:hypothetical protein
MDTCSFGFRDKAGFEIRRQLQRDRHFVLSLIVPRPTSKEEAQPYFW